MKDRCGPPLPGTIWISPRQWPEVKPCYWQFFSCVYDTVTDSYCLISLTLSIAKFGQ